MSAHPRGRAGCRLAALRLSRGLHAAVQTARILHGKRGTPRSLSSRVVVRQHRVPPEVTGRDGRGLPHRADAHGSTGTRRRMEIHRQGVYRFPRHLRRPDATRVRVGVRARRRRRGRVARSARPAHQLHGPVAGADAELAARDQRHAVLRQTLPGRQRGLPGPGRARGTMARAADRARHDGGQRVEARTRSPRRITGHSLSRIHPRAGQGPGPRQCGQTGHPPPRTIRPS